MKEGLLWFDDDPKRQLADKVGRAATRYRVKFGHRPTVCYLNLADFEDKTEQINGIRLQVASNVLPHHFWIGVDNETRLAKAA